MMGVWILTLFLDKLGGIGIPKYFSRSKNPVEIVPESEEQLWNILVVIDDENSEPLQTWTIFLYPNTGSESITSEKISSSPEVLIPLDFNSSDDSTPANITVTNPTNISNTSGQLLQSLPTDQQDTHSLEISSLEKKIREYENRPTIVVKSEKKKLHSESRTESEKNEQYLRKQHIQNLEKLYKEKKRTSDLKKLIQELVKNYEFNDAWKYLQQTDIQKEQLVSPSLYIYTYFNSIDLVDAPVLEKFQTTLNDFTTNTLITEQEKRFYQWLVLILQKKYDQLSTQRENISDERYQGIISNVQKIQEKVKTKRDIPIYYQDSLIALEMLKSGYFSLAKELATQSLMKNEKYILPYQVLAYSNFLTNNLHEAISHFQQLTKIDPAKHNSYKYMMGISYYRLGDYTNAILHLSQLKNNTEFRTDVLRYLILGYKHIDDRKRMLSTYQELIIENHLIAGDFVDFFRSIFVIPYEETGKINIDSSTLQLSVSYLQSCQANKATDQDICLLGEVWIYAAQHQWDREIHKKLKKLLSAYNQNFTLQLLGDYYRYTNQYKIANEYYLKATLASESEQEKNIIQQKLLLLRETE